MRHLGIQILILTLLTACSYESTSVDGNDQGIDTTSESTKKSRVSNISEEDNTTEKYLPDRLTQSKSEIINPKYPIDFLFNDWAHKKTDDNPAFSINNEFFEINNDDKTDSVLYILHLDSIEIFEYSHGQTSKGKIAQLTKDSLTIKWATGDENKYVRHEK